MSRPNEELPVRYTTRTPPYTFLFLLRDGPTVRQTRRPPFRGANNASEKAPKCIEPFLFLLPVSIRCFCIVDPITLLLSINFGTAGLQVWFHFFSQTNHFPGIGPICNKVQLCTESSNKYIPQTFQLPRDKEIFLKEVSIVLQYVKAGF